MIKSDTLMETNNLGLTLDSILQEVDQAADSMGSNQRFKLPIAKSQLESMLTKQYENCVRYRNREYVSTNEVCENLHKVAGWLTGTSIKPMLMLCGNVGTGKTIMAQSIKLVVEHLGDSARKLEKELGSRMTTHQLDPEASKVFGYYVRLTNPLMCTAQSLTKMEDRGNNNYAKAIKSKFLIVDDLGVEPPCVKVFGVDTYPLVDLISYRYNALSTTVFTSNLLPIDIANHYGSRIADRLEEVCERIVFRGDSFRRK